MGDPPWLSTPALLITAGVFGTMLGSFFNVCIARVPRGESVVRPASHCFSCGRTVLPWDNIPILSYLWLRGRCRFCGVRFSPRYLLVEALTGVLAALVCWKFVVADPELAPGVRAARFALYFAFTGVLVVLSFIDLDTKRLPDAITLPSIPIFFLAAFAAQDVPWLPRLIGLAVGYLLVRVIADGYYYLTGREGLGLGDGKLLAVVGAVLGWRAIPFTIFLASFLGIAVSVPVLLAQRRRAPAPEPALEPRAPEGDPPPEILPPVRRTEVPFGPFLSLSAIIYLMVGDSLWNWLVTELSGG
ncbi:MAG TPA: prepilin peptidase [Polyangia bacterium]|nr:prepilin peptidase [Polyangia bacterium]